MGSLLRCGKLVKCIDGFARSIMLNSHKDLNFIDCTKTLNKFQSQFRDYSAATAGASLDPKLAQLDTDVRRLGRINRKDIDNILEEIRHKYAISSSQSLLIIRCCGELVPEELPSSRTQLVQQIWRVLEDRGVPLDISHYNALLRVYIENEHTFSPAEFLNDLEKKGIQPNRVTYQRLMWSYCQAGNVEGATQVLERMRELSLPISEPVLNALVMGHAFHDDVAGAKSVLETMASAGLQPSERTYTLLACGLAKQGDIDGIERLLSECTEKDIILGDRDLLEIVEALAVNGHSDLTNRILNEMKKGPGYNQDAINIIYRLLNQAQDEVALKVLISMTSPVQSEGNQNLYQGAFFVKHLVKIGSAERTTNMCRTLQEAGLAPMAYAIAAEEALSDKKVDLAVTILKEMHTQGMPIRQHYFWPILLSQAKDKKAIHQTLKTMTDVFGLVPGHETLREYVIPFLNKKNFDAEINELVNSGVKFHIAAQSFLYNLLLSNNLEGAATLGQNYRFNPNFELLFRPLLTAFEKTHNVSSFVRLAHILCIKDDNNNKEDTDSDKLESNNVSKDNIGRLLHSAILSVNSNKLLVNQLLEGFLKDGLSINGNWANKIQDILGSQLSPEIAENLSKLTSTELEPVQLQKSSMSHQWVVSSEKLEQWLETDDGKSKGIVKRNLIISYIREDKKDKLIAFLQNLENEQYFLTSGMMATLLDYFSQSNDIEQALKYKNLILEKEPEFVLDNIKILRLTLALVKGERYEEVLSFLEKINTNEPQKETFLINSLAWQILNKIAEEKDVAMVNKTTELLLAKKLVTPTNLILGSSIKVHLLQDDLDKALETFENFCTKYRCTPWKAEITRRLIMKEDASRLQRLTDLSTTVHGEINSLYDLVFAFVECGRLRQARKILETPGLWSRTNRLNNACERYEQEGKIEHLEGLIEATKELMHIDRSELYYHLLVAYCKENLSDKALALWTQLQEEDITPSDKFLIHLADHLKAKNEKVPFVIPEVYTPPAKETTTKPPPVKQNIIKIRDQQPSNIMAAINIGDIDKALDLALDDSNKNANLNDRSEVMKKLIENERLDDAMKLLTFTLDKKKKIPDSVLRLLVRKLTESGNIEALEIIDKHSNPHQKATTAIQGKICSVKFLSGHAEQYLTEVEKKLLESKSSDDYIQVSHEFPKPNSLQLIKDNQPLIKKCFEIAEKLADQNIIAPMNSLWIFYFINSLKEEADSVWNKYFINYDKEIKFVHILNTAYQNEDPELIISLIQKLKEKKLYNQSALGVVYSRLLEVYIKKNEIDNIERSLNDALKSGLTYEHISNDTLSNIKEMFKVNGKSVTF